MLKMYIERRLDNGWVIEPSTPAGVQVLNSSQKMIYKSSYVSVFRVDVHVQSNPVIIQSNSNHLCICTPPDVVQFYTRHVRGTPLY